MSNKKAAPNKRGDSLLPAVDLKQAKT